MRLTDRFRSWRLRRSVDDRGYVPPANLPHRGIELKEPEAPAQPRNRAERRQIRKLVKFINRYDARRRLSQKGQSRGRYTPPRARGES